MKKLFILFALFAHVLAAQTVPNYVPTNGLVGWWPFNGNGNDLSGNGNNSISTTATFTQDRNSIQNAAIQLGTGIVQLPQTVFNFNYSSTFTFCCWFTHSASGNDRLVSTECPEGNFRIANWGGNGVFATQFGTYIIDTLINPTQWNNYIFTYSNKNAKVYLNGILVSVSYNNSNENVSYCNPFTIGAKASQTNVDLWDGKIDDIGIWNRVLTPAEIQTLYFGCTDTLVQNPTSATAIVGTNATFTALSSASGATYQWQVKSGGTVTNVSNAGQFSGATSSTLSVSNISSANNGMEFRCIVDHGLCLDTTDFATLSICSGAFLPTVDTVPSALTFSSVQSITAPAVVPSSEIWKINQITYQSIPAQATNNTGTQTVVDKIQINCQEIIVRKTTTSSNNSGASNALNWETKLPIWLPPGTLIEPGTGVEAINIIRFSSNPL